jgi:holo-[acyl-carrier protein] synthase
VSTVGVGIDLVDVNRFAALLSRRPGVIARVFTDNERADSRGRVTSLAARFAAKEATWKALGLGLGATRFHDVEVRTSPSGAPQLRLAGRAALYADRADVATWHVSLSHTDGCAAAVVVASS